MIEAGAVLASSLDPTTTMGQVADLTVPRLADLCVIDLRDETDGSIRDVAVVATDAKIGQALERLRGRFPLNPEGEHPVARVIRSGESELQAEMSGTLLESFAQSSEHARFMIEHGYRSAVIVPLLARGRTLGALSVLRLGESPPYRDEDVELVSELGRRAGLAIDNARLYSDLQRAEQHLEAVLANLAEAITVTDEHGQMVFANQAAADLLGAATPAELMSAPPGSIMPRFLVLDEQGRELDLQRMPGRRLFTGEDARPMLMRNIVRTTGEERWLNVRSSPVLDADSGRVLYAVNVFENITEVKRAQLTESFMAQASRVLSSSMDYNETLQRVARLAVPAIADWCAIDLVSERGTLDRVAAHHSDPQKLALAQRLSESYQPALNEPLGVPEVIRTAQTRIYTEIEPHALAAYARDDEHLRLLSEIGATAVIIVPIIGAKEPIGAITLVSAESLRRLSPADLALAERLGRRAGTAVENARLYTERSNIAHILQQALLPHSLPDIPQAEIEALYSAVGELNEVGGDFYDVFDYGPDRWMLVIGDVCGKGPRAASVTALARHTLRAAAVSGQTPTEMLDALHQALRRQPTGADLCTVCLVTVAPDRGGRTSRTEDGTSRTNGETSRTDDGTSRTNGETSSTDDGTSHTNGGKSHPEDGTSHTKDGPAADGAKAHLTVTLAGHPQPLLVDADGSVRTLGQPGTLLGVLDPISVSEHAGELRADQTLVLYTDGVPDAGRSDRRLGEEGLMELCGTAPERSLRDLLEHIERVALQRAEGKPRDDIALLALRLLA